MINITEFMASVHQFLSKRQINAKSLQRYEFTFLLISYFQL